MFIENLARAGAKKALGRFGLRLTRQPEDLNPYFHNPETSYVVSQKLQDLFLEELVSLSFNELTSISDFRKFSDNDFRVSIKKFLEVFRKRPKVFTKDSNIGGSGFDNAFWIFLIADLLGPSVAVESGVWKGQTSWLLEQACPDAKIHGFDISLKNLKKCTKKVLFHNCDWSDMRLEVDPDAIGLCFFDCHVNHSRRLKEAFERGFRFVLLDDNVPAHLVHAFASPPLPSLEMTLNGNFKPGDYIEWKFRGKVKRYTFTEGDFQGIGEIIDEYILLPDIGTRTRYGRYSYLSIVKLKSSFSQT